MEYLARRRRVVPLDAIVDACIEPGPPAVAIAFDDGYRSVLTEAVPRLVQHGFTATVFVASGWIGAQNVWDNDATELELMTADELREAQAAGLSIESHGHKHIDLRAATVDSARKDVEASRAELTKLFGRPPRYLAYPWGNSSPESRAVVRDAHFLAAFSIDVPGEGDFSRERIGITCFDGPRLFALKTSGRYLTLRHSSLLSRAYALTRGVVNRGRRT